MPSPELGLDLAREVGPVLDDAGEDERPPGRARHPDGLGRALVGMDAAEEQQVPARLAAGR